MLPIFVCLQTLGANASWGFSWPVIWLFTAISGQALLFAVKQKAHPRYIVWSTMMVLVLVATIPSAFVLQTGGNWIGNEITFLTITYVFMGISLIACGSGFKFNSQY
jgi:hypothetical protein